MKKCYCHKSEQLYRSATVQFMVGKQKIPWNYSKGFTYS